MLVQFLTWYILHSLVQFLFTCTDQIWSFSSLSGYDEKFPLIVASSRLSIKAPLCGSTMLPKKKFESVAMSMRHRLWEWMFFLDQGFYFDAVTKGTPRKDHMRVPMETCLFVKLEDHSRQHCCSQKRNTKTLAGDWAVTGIIHHWKCVIQELHRISMLEPDGQQRPRRVNVSLDGKNRSLLRLRNLWGHICQRDLCGTPATQGGKKEKEKKHLNSEVFKKQNIAIRAEIVLCILLH